MMKAGVIAFAAAAETVLLFILKPKNQDFGAAAHRNGKSHFKIGIRSCNSGSKAAFKAEVFDFERRQVF